MRAAHVRGDQTFFFVVLELLIKSRDFVAAADAFALARSEALQPFESCLTLSPESVYTYISVHISVYIRALALEVVSHTLARVGIYIYIGAYIGIYIRALALRVVSHSLADSFIYVHIYMYTYIGEAGPARVSARLCGGSVRVGTSPRPAGP
jgi:hypothetical protein